MRPKHVRAQSRESERAGPRSPLLARLAGGRAAYAWASLLLLIPCFWQPRVEAGDLSSHIYNAWLAQLIESGRVQGLSVVNQTSNVLFDLLMGGLFRIVGAEAAQRISVSLAVLIFIWGAFAYVRAVTGRPCWYLVPSIAMLAYGWVFHMGFFNFYLSLGMCFWALALAWDLRPRRVAAAMAVLVVAYVAHGLPVAWTVCLLVFLWLTHRAGPRQRIYITLGTLVATVLLRVVIGAALVSRWSFEQITLTTGADQVWVFDGKYYGVLIALLLVWGLLFLDLLRRSGSRQVASSVTFQLCALSALGVFILPTTVLIPGFHHTLTYIAERMSLGVGICVCGLLGAAQPRAWERYALAAVAVVFFVFIYRDERALNAVEDRMQDVVAQLGPGQRVVSGVLDPGLRVPTLDHMIDRVCVGRCFSYANYEPSTWQFRVRALGPNPLVTASYPDSWLMQTGGYVVKESDVPLYQVYVDRRGTMLIRSLQVGMPCGSTWLKALPDLFPNG
jgi:hypothetical protein